MKKLTVLIENGKKMLYLNSPSEFGSIMRLNTAIVYWKYFNITEDEDITQGIKTITFEKGYWTFSMIRDKLSSYSVKLEATRHNNKCIIQSNSGDLNLGVIGPLIGFPSGTVIPSGIWTYSPSTVNINLGIRYITINCNMVNTSENNDTTGAKSYSLVTLPTPTSQSLNGSVSYFNAISSEVQVNGGFQNLIIFDIPEKINVDVLLELYFSW